MLKTGVETLGPEFSVLAVPSGEEAVLEIAMGEFDLLVTDVRLPGISGLEFLERLRKDPLTLSIPVIVLTTSDREDEIKTAYQKGANSYIVKPARYDDFVVKLTEMNMYWGETAEVPDSTVLSPLA